MNALVGREVMLLKDKSILIDVVKFNIPEGMLVILLFINVMLT